MVDAVELENKIRYVIRNQDGELVGYSVEPYRDPTDGEWRSDSADVIVPLEDHEYFVSMGKDSMFPWAVANYEREFITVYMPNNGDAIRHVNHYFGIFNLEVETVLQNFIPKYKDAYIGHRIASAVEYVLRAPEKNGIEDLKKAHRNLEQAIEHFENRGDGIL